MSGASFTTTISLSLPHPLCLSVFLLYILLFWSTLPPSLPAIFYILHTNHKPDLESLSGSTFVASLSSLSLPLMQFGSGSRLLHVKNVAQAALGIAFVGGSNSN